MERPMEYVYEKFGLQPYTMQFIGHAMALHLDDEYGRCSGHWCNHSYSRDSYLLEPAGPTCERIKLYSTSVLRYGKSPYIYPIYGLGELPQAFARLSAVYGGTYMLDKKIDEIITDEDGKFIGVRSGEEIVKAKMVIGDPSYFGAGENNSSGKLWVTETAKVVRAICILKHHIPDTDGCDSAQIIIPAEQVRRKNGTLLFFFYIYLWLICQQTFTSQ